MPTLKLFTEAVCPTGEHCAFCRKKEDGRGFRAAMARSFVMPDGMPDFECPSGHAWGSSPPKPEPKPKPVKPDPIAAYNARPVLPIDPGETPEKVRVQLRRGGCCSPPARE